MAQVLYVPFPTVTPTQELIAQAIADGTFFQYNVTPTGLINDSNTVFTLSAIPNPATSLELRLNGMILKAGAGNDFTLSGSTITMAVAPASGDTLTATYTVSPV